MGLSMPGGLALPWAWGWGWGSPFDGAEFFQSAVGLAVLLPVIPVTWFVAFYLYDAANHVWRYHDVEERSRLGLLKPGTCVRYDPANWL